MDDRINERCAGKLQNYGEVYLEYAKVFADFVAALAELEIASLEFGDRDADWLEFSYTGRDYRLGLSFAVRDDEIETKVKLFEWRWPADAYAQVGELNINQEGVFDAPQRTPERAALRTLDKYPSAALHLLLFGHLTDS